MPDAMPQEDEQDWWAELMGEEETLRLEDLIPARMGRKSGEHWRPRSSRTGC